MLKAYEISALPFVLETEHSGNTLFIFKDKNHESIFLKSLYIFMKLKDGELPNFRRMLISSDEKIKIACLISLGEKNIVTATTLKDMFQEVYLPSEIIRISEGEKIRPSELLSFLIRNGYTRVQSDPTFPGDFSLVGDVFEIKVERNINQDASKDVKIRIEFFFDTVEKIYRIYSDGKVERPKEEIIISRIKGEMRKYFDLFDEVICFACNDEEKMGLERNIICSIHSRGSLKNKIHQNLSEIRIISASDFIREKDDLIKLKNQMKNLVIAVKDGEEEIYFREILGDRYGGRAYSIKSRQKWDDFTKDEFTPSDGCKINFIYVNDYPESFIIPQLSFSLISLQVLSAGKKKRDRERKLKIGDIGLPEISYEDLEEGMYVVHKVHGIGIFRGTSIEYGREFLKIEYKDSAMLYIPAEDISLLHKYIGAENPPLDELGGKTFALRKIKVKEYIERQIPEFLRALAIRKSIKRPSYKGGDEILPLLSQTFLFEETEDQKKAIEDIREDLCEKDYPADRLIVGDSGVGKTEVALRGMGIVAYSGKQVAFICPTTPLAFQHYMRIKERLSEFPFRIEMLSRITPPQKQREIIHGIKTGEIDIVVGTHKVLNHLHEFKNLGLLVIDEEQRFGVAHKEKISRIRASVDVISLSATPIPRTLKMALSGLKDISTIKQKPFGRGAIITSLLPKVQYKINEVIDYELKRDGQVFYIYPFIEGLDEIVIRLSKYFQVPISVVHGRMKPSEIEDIILNFIVGKIKILVATKIVALGLDIPNVNTMIIERADLFGLSDLYQLRGRVGRGDKTAYCYLIVGEKISDTARKRLDVFLDAVNLDPENAGFFISLKDLEMRGAGNLLGKEQVGHIYSVGFDTYLQILQDVIREVREKMEDGRKSFLGVEQKEYESEIPQSQLTNYDFEPHVDIPIPAFIPSQLVRDPVLRLSFYRAFALAETEKELENILAMILERFAGIELGKNISQRIKEVEVEYPELINFFKISKLKLLMRKRKIFSAVFSKDMTLVELESKNERVKIPVSGIDELIKILSFEDEEDRV